MAGSQHFSPGDIQFQLVYDRGQCAETSYLKVKQTPSNILDKSITVRNAAQGAVMLLHPQTDDISF